LGERARIPANADLAQRMGVVIKKSGKEKLRVEKRVIGGLWWKRTKPEKVGDDDKDRTKKKNNERE